MSTPVKRPPGRPPRIPTEYPTSGLQLQDPGTRAKTLIQKHGPEKVLRALRDEKFLEKNFTTYDGMLIMGIGAALKGSGDERERMFNRMFGKVPDKQINLNLNIDINPATLSNRAREMLDRIGSEDGGELIEG